MKLVLRISVFLILISQACIDQVPLDFPVDESRTLVVDALISDYPEESLITIGWTFPSDVKCVYNSDGLFPVPCEVDNSGGPYSVTGKVILSDETGHQHEYPIRMKNRVGFIRIEPAIAGTPGVKYFMDIEINYNQKTSLYHAETRMIKTPPISWVSYVIRTGQLFKEDAFVPLISFHEPQHVDNYYLFFLCELSRKSTTDYCSAGITVSSVIQDDFLPEYVEGLSVDDGASILKYRDFYPHVTDGVGARVTMSSVTRETYEFYKASLDQFYNDGGAYSPTPSTPGGNISGGAIGLFRAQDSSVGEIYLE